MKVTERDKNGNVIQQTTGQQLSVHDHKIVFVVYARHTVLNIEMSREELDVYSERMLRERLK